MSELVLLPGMNCSADLWTGCGLDARTPVLSEPTMDRQLAALLAQLPEKFVLGGLSLGAIVAMAMAVSAPERIEGLLLVSTNAKAPTDAQRRGWRDWLGRLDSGESARELQQGILPQLLSPDAAARPGVAERVLAMGDSIGEATLAAQLALQDTREDLRTALRAVRVPTLVVSGGQDPICPSSFHSEIAGIVPSAELVTLDAGHLLPMERPAGFGRVVRRWLGEFGHR